MVGRIRDFHGRVINPKDHFVLPNKQKPSRSDMRDLLSNPSVWRGNRAEARLQLQSLIPQLLDYMVSPWKGAPTVAGKLHGGAFTDLFNQWVDDESSENDRTPAIKRKKFKNHSLETTAPFMRGNFIPRRPNQPSPPSTLPNPFAPPPARPSAPTGFSYPPSNDPFATENNRSMDDAPPLRRRARPPPAAPPAPPAAPEPPAPPPPVPPLNVPVYPVAPNDPRSPFHKLLDEAMRLNSSSAVKKLCGLVGNNNAHTLTLQQVVTATGLSEEEVQMLTSISANHLYGQHDNTTISSNGVPVVHVHNSTYQPFNGPPRPLMIKTNSGTAQIKVR